MKNPAPNNELKLIIINGNSHEFPYSIYYLKAYEYWKKNWLTQFRKNDPNFIQFSDNYLRQKEIFCLFSNDEPIALVALDYFNLNFQSQRDHSYFSEIPFDIINSLIESDKAEFVTLNQLLVTNMWIENLRTVDIITGLIVFRLMTTHLNQGVCYTRNLGKINKLAQRWGGQIIRPNIIIHNEPSDFVVFPKNSFITANMPKEKELVQSLWCEAELDSHHFNLHPLLGYNSQFIINKEEKYEQSTQREFSI